MKPLGGPLLRTADVRAAELACGISPETLMENAGRALAEAVLRFGGGAPVLILCGPGNNGGDGYVAARLLAARGVSIELAALGDPKTDLAKAARGRWMGEVMPLRLAASAPVLVDALFGTGLTRALDSEVRLTLERLAASSRIIIAADLPSGVGTDDGHDLGAVTADITLAFGAAKPAHLLQPAAGLCGRVLVADIGMAATSNMDVLPRPRLLAPGPTDHKYSRGMVAVIAGPIRGAATLAVTAAAHLSGYTVLCGTAAAPACVVRRGFEATLAHPKLRALLIGPGLTEDPKHRARVESALASSVPLVLDAGALAMLTAEKIRRAAATILTPHEGEFVRLFGAVGGSKLERAHIAARRSGATVVFKGSDTVIASPDGRVTVASAAAPWLATAGTGDVLAGIVTAILGHGLDPHQAACAAVWVHSEAARRAGPAFIADELCMHIPAAIGIALS